MSLFADRGYDRARLLSQAARARARGRRRKAIALYRRVLEVEPHNDVLHKRVAQMLAQARRIDEALGHYRKAADGLINRGFEDHAIAVYRESLHFHPKVTWVWSTVAKLEAQRGRVPDAVETLRDGARCFRSGRARGDALSLLGQAHRLDPGSAAAGLDLSRVLLKLGHRRRALGVLDEVVPHVRGRDLRRIRGRQFNLSPTPAALCRYVGSCFSRGRRDPIARPADAAAG